MAILIFQHSDHCLPGRLGAVLRDHGNRLDIIRTDRGQIEAANLDEAHAVVSLGGPQNLDEEHPWMQEEMRLMREARDRGCAVVGVCLGAQLLAAALGGEVEKMERPEIGFHTMTLTFPGTIDSIFAGVGWRTEMFHSHTRRISTLPDGAIALASSEQSPVQAFSAGPLTYGFQFHFEAYRETVRLWADQGPEHLEQAGISRAEYDAQCEAHYDSFARIADRLCLNIAALLVPQGKRLYA